MKTLHGKKLPVFLKNIYFTGQKNLIIYKFNATEFLADIKKLVSIMGEKGI